MGRLALQETEEEDIFDTVDTQPVSAPAHSSLLLMVEAMSDPQLRCLQRTEFVCSVLVLVLNLVVSCRLYAVSVDSICHARCTSHSIVGAGRRA